MDDKVSVLSELVYEDPAAALAWLAEAFDFRTRMVVADADGRIVFAETGWCDCTVAVVPEHAGLLSPRRLGAASQTVQMRSNRDVDSHCARARAAGAVILSEPQDTFFGDRTYMAADPEGHVWNFGQRRPAAGGPPPKGWTVSFPTPEA